MSSAAYEINFDGLVGPTHSYGGLSWGNKPSLLHKGGISNPRSAALQGLLKMKMVFDFGTKQGFFLPHERPYFPLLHQMGFQGNPSHVLAQAKKKAPWVIPYAFSASSMWAANSATMTPSIDSALKKAQFTPANLQTHLHRSIEPPFTHQLLQKIFPNPVFFQHHSPLPSTPFFSDEGAANSLRLAKSHLTPGIHLFVFGESKTEGNWASSGKKYSPRQTKEAQEALAELHQIYEKQIVLVEQNQEATDLGAFHNDLLAMSHLNLLIVHEEAWKLQPLVIRQLQEKMESFALSELVVIQISKELLSLEEALQTFFFNGQLLSLPNGTMALFAPIECQLHPKAKKAMDELVQNPSNPIQEVHYIDLSQSMKNGGGPACLRLRVQLNENELREMDSRFLIMPDIYQKLTDWVKKHYRDRLLPDDLFDPLFARECQEALDALTRLLAIGPIYSFQR